jgi:hypothetical protein
LYSESLQSPGRKNPRFATIFTLWSLTVAVSHAKKTAVIVIPFEGKEERNPSAFWPEDSTAVRGRIPSKQAVKCGLGRRWAGTRQPVTSALRRAPGSPSTPSARSSPTPWPEARPRSGPCYEPRAGRVQTRGTRLGAGRSRPIFSASSRATCSSNADHGHRCGTPSVCPSCLHGLLASIPSRFAVAVGPTPLCQPGCSRAIALWLERRYTSACVSPGRSRLPRAAAWTRAGAARRPPCRRRSMTWRNRANASGVAQGRGVPSSRRERVQS